MFSNIGFPEVFAVAVLTLLVFGPDRLPELARNAARFVSRFRAEASKSLADLREAADLGEIEQEVRSLRSELTGVRDDLTRGLRGPADAAAKPVSRGGPTAAPDTSRTGPPPFDPEAT